MKPQFDYLKALAIAKVGTTIEFKEALENVASNYPSEEVGKAAQEILNRINKMEEDKVKRESLYKKNFRDQHIVVIMAPSRNKIVDDIKIALSNYNVASQGAGKLTVGAVMFDSEFQMISIKSFSDKDEAMVYLQNVTQFPDFMEKVVKNNYDRFIISTENFAYFYKEKDVPAYISFYNDNYLK